MMLETDDMVQDFQKQGFSCVDLETACFYALGLKLGLNVAAIHIVTDNPVKKMIDQEKFHEASFTEQIHTALRSFNNI
jgi:purine-nucleoside phosphorylase